MHVLPARKLKNLKYLHRDLPEWLGEFTENLEDEGMLAPRDTPASTSRESDSELSRKVVSAKHCIFTHFSEDRNCDICLRTKIARPLAGHALVMCWESSTQNQEGFSAVLLQSDLDEKWFAGSMECYCFLRNTQDLPSDGKTHPDRRFGEPFSGPVEYHPISAKDKSILHQFGKKVLCVVAQPKRHSAMAARWRKGPARVRKECSCLVSSSVAWFSTLRDECFWRQCASRLGPCMRVGSMCDFTLWQQVCTTSVPEKSCAR